MRAITQGHQTLDAILARVHTQLRELVDHGKGPDGVAIAGLRRAPPPGPALPCPPSARSRGRGASTGDPRRSSRARPEPSPRGPR